LPAEISERDREAYAAYLGVRDEVARLKASAPVSGGTGAPSRYWAEELSNIDYLADASPLVVRKLRHHAFHITGIRPYDYREYADSRHWFERRLRALIALDGGSGLLVPEADALGGFGYRIDGRLYNVDTIKFFEALVAMRRAGLLERFSADADRRLAWEIGAGWGGFAYQFKTLFPNTTYLIVDFPELFLFSATYLATVFPQARMRFWGDGGAVLDRWQEADFIFVPNDRADALAGVRPDLLVNLISFQEMTSAQVTAYAGLAAASGCPSIYSFNRDRSHYNEELDSVSRVLSQFYELREVRLLGSGYMKATKKDSAVTLEEALRTGRIEEGPCRHLVGRLRPAMEVSSADAHVGRPETPRVGLGIALHNRAMYLAEALDSILAQSYPHFRVVLVDDGSSDGTETLARRYVERDPRVRYVRFEERRGMVAAWRTAFEQASADGASYFAWGSDHDRWHGDWLATLVETLQQHPDAVLAYPLTQRIDPAGMPLEKPARQFETAGMTDLRARWTHLSRSDSVAAGDMVYGLMRVEAVRAAGVFREVLCPDRLLIAELTLRGEIRQVPDVLWFRRQFPAGSITRQRSTLFPPGTTGPLPFTPPWYLHARALWATYGADGSLPGLSRPEVARLIASYAGAYAWRHYGKSSVQRGALSVLGWPRWIYKRARHALLLGVYASLVTLRKAGVTPRAERLYERITGRPRPWRGHA
jgi:hypothetical protein